MIASSGAPGLVPRSSARTRPHGGLLDNPAAELARFAAKYTKDAKVVKRSAGAPPSGSSEHHLDVVLRAVVGQGHERSSRERAPVEADPGDAPADALRILDADPVDAAAVSIGDLEAFPRSGDAGIDAQGGALLAEPENPFQACAVEPARRPGVPGPSPAADVGRLRIDVRGYGVRLPLVAVGLRATAPGEG